MSPPSPEIPSSDGTTPPRRRRRRGRGRGFDIDSRVQVFEATIRILGGLLSAHLYATGEFGALVFPVPESLELSEEEERSGVWGWFGKSGGGVRTTGSGYKYDGHLLDLAYDLGERMLPAFEKSMGGVPFPRVNMRHGLQFAGGSGAAVGDSSGEKVSGGYSYEYGREGANFNLSSFYHGPIQGRVPGESWEDEEELDPLPRTEEQLDTITSTCPAGAGSLVLEFTVLSRLTGDGRFEEVAKRAFDSVWRIKSGIGLLGVELKLDEKTGELGGHWAQYFSGVSLCDELFRKNTGSLSICLLSRRRWEEFEKKKKIWLIVDWLDWCGCRFIFGVRPKGIYSTLSLSRPYTPSPSAS